MTRPPLARPLAVAALVALLGASAAAFAADDAVPAAAAASKDVGVLGVVVIAAVVIGGVAGIGCAAAILGALFPRIAAAVDRQARAGAPTVPLLVGSLVVVGIAAILAGLAHAAGPGAASVAFLLLGVPAILLLLAGSTATVPLLGERLLGTRGRDAAPLTRAVVGSLALGAALLPGFVFQLHVLGFVVAMAVLGWPVGVGLAAALAGRRGRGRAASPAPAPPHPTDAPPAPPPG